MVESVKKKISLNYWITHIHHRDSCLMIRLHHLDNHSTFQTAITNRLMVEYVIQTRNNNHYNNPIINKNQDDESQEEVAASFLRYAVLWCDERLQQINHHAWFISITQNATSKKSSSAIVYPQQNTTLSHSYPSFYMSNSAKLPICSSYLFHAYRYVKWCLDVLVFIDIHHNNSKFLTFHLHHDILHLFLSSLSL